MNEAAHALIRRVEKMRELVKERRTTQYKEDAWEAMDKLTNEVESMLGDFLDVLLVYGAHKPDCAPPEGRTPDGRCDCGLEAIKKELGK